MKTVKIIYISRYLFWSDLVAIKKFSAKKSFSKQLDKSSIFSKLQANQRYEEVFPY